MNRTRKWIGLSVLALAAAFATANITDALVCVVHKAYKIRRVCGIVVDLEGSPISGAQVDVSKEKADPDWQMNSGPDGRFAFSGIPAGTYELRVRYPNFVSAWQPIVITRPTKSNSCAESLQVKLTIAGDCTWVSIEKSK
jgi:carboxypeptidase family protein